MFLPWIGPDFGKANNPIGGRRLMVVAESHHADGANHAIGTTDPDFTVGVVETYKSCPREGWMRTFDNIAAAIGERSKPELGRDGVNAIWDAIAFYNYVPVFAATAARQRPTIEMFRLGQEPFRRAVDMVQPEVVLVAGYAVWDWVVYHQAETEFHKPVDPAAPFAPLSKVGGLTAMRMKHPSTAFSPTAWRPLIRRLLARDGT